MLGLRSKPQTNWENWDSWFSQKAFDHNTKDLSPRAKAARLQMKKQRFNRDQKKELKAQRAREKEQAEQMKAMGESWKKKRAPWINGDTYTGGGMPDIEGNPTNMPYDPNYRSMSFLNPFTLGAAVGSGSSFTMKRGSKPNFKDLGSSKK